MFESWSHCPPGCVVAQMGFSQGHRARKRSETGLEPYPLLPRPVQLPLKSSLFHRLGHQEDTLALTSWLVIPKQGVPTGSEEEERIHQKITSASNHLTLEARAEDVESGRLGAWAAWMGGLEYLMGGHM